MAPQRCRADLEAVWRLRLEHAAQRHKLAKANGAKVLEEFTSGRTDPSDGWEAVKRAAMEENAAREEHLRVLKIFTDLVVRRSIPPEDWSC